MNKIEYKKEMLDLVKNLSTINNSIIFEKEEDNVVIKRSDAEKTIVYYLKAPKDYFNFPNDKIAFYNYNEFYQYFNTFDNPNVESDESRIYLSEGNAEIVYILSNPDSITPGPKQINFKSPDFSFELNSESLDELYKMNTLIRAKKAEISGNGKTIKIRLFNNEHDNSFNKTFEIQNASGFTDDFDFIIFSELFTHIPLKKNYKISVKNSGYVCVSLVDDNISLDIFTGHVKA